VIGSTHTAQPAKKPLKAKCGDCKTNRVAAAAR
jgi:hypothetical protein